MSDVEVFQWATNMIDSKADDGTLAQFNPNTEQGRRDLIAAARLLLQDAQDNLVRALAHPLRHSFISPRGIGLVLCHLAQVRRQDLGPVKPVVKPKVKFERPYRVFLFKSYENSILESRQEKVIKSKMELGWSTFCKDPKSNRFLRTR